MAVDPMTAAMIASAAGQSLSKVFGSAAQIDPLSKEQRENMKRLERQEALGLLGMTPSEQQRMLTQSLQPVKTSQRELQQKFAQSQQVQDVGQGAAFRQQQALAETQGDVIAKATEAAQDQIAQLQELAIARDMARLDALKEQQRTNLGAIAGIVGGVGEGVAMGADIMVQHKQEQDFQNMLLGAKQKVMADNAGASSPEASEYLDAWMSDPSAAAVKGAMQTLSFQQAQSQRLTPTQEALYSLADVQFGRTGQQFGSPLPTQADMIGMLPQRYIDEPREQGDIDSDFVPNVWGGKADARIIRDPSTGMIVSVKITEKDSGFERTYTYGEDPAFFKNIMKDLMDAGYGGV